MIAEIGSSPLLNAATNWIVQYGNIVLFVLLALGIVGLPLPDEALLVLTGILCVHQKLNLPMTWITVIAGAIVGITLSYLIGRSAGHYLLIKYGPRMGITAKKVERIHQWFEKMGKWSLVFGYFIPGVRHLTGYIAGTTELPWDEFALFAYTGAIFWASLFLMLGYFLGDQAFVLLSLAQHFLDEIMWVTVSLLIAGAVTWWWLARKKNKKTNKKV